MKRKFIAPVVAATICLSQAVPFLPTEASAATATGATCGKMSVLSDDINTIYQISDITNEGVFITFRKNYNPKKKVAITVRYKTDSAWVIQSVYQTGLIKQTYSDGKKRVLFKWAKNIPTQLDGSWRIKYGTDYVSYTNCSAADNDVIVTDFTQKVENLINRKAAIATIDDFSTAIKGLDNQFNKMTLTQQRLVPSATTDQLKFYKDQLKLMTDTEANLTALTNDSGTYFDKFYPTLVMYNQIDPVFDDIKTNLMDPSLTNFDELSLIFKDHARYLLESKTGTIDPTNANNLVPEFNSLNGVSTGIDNNYNLSVFVNNSLTNLDIIKGTAVDLRKAANVVTKIEQLKNSTPSINSVITTRNLYEALSFTQKQYVWDIDDLTNIEKNNSTISNQLDTINRFTDYVNQMDGSFDADNLSNAEQYFSLAKLTYEDINSLNLLQYVDLSTLSKYQQYETAYPVFLQFESLYKSTVKNAADTIAYNNAYKRLPSTTKTLILNGDKFLVDEDNIKKANSVIRQIDAIRPESSSFLRTIIAVRTAYTKLTDDQQKFVTNLDKLEGYEAEYQNETEAINGFNTAVATPDWIAAEKYYDIVNTQYPKYKSLLDSSAVRTYTDYTKALNVNTTLETLQSNDANSIYNFIKDYKKLTRTQRDIFNNLVLPSNQAAVTQYLKDETAIRTAVSLNKQIDTAISKNKAYYIKSAKRSYDSYVAKKYDTNYLVNADLLISLYNSL